MLKLVRKAACSHLHKNLQKERSINKKGARRYGVTSFRPGPERQNEIFFQNNVQAHCKALPV